MPAVMPSDYLPLDRAYAERIPFTAKEPRLEDPIIPLNSIGQTVPELDPATGANILQNIQAVIRRGVGNMQLVMSVGPDSAMGGRFKAYGKEVREQLKEVMLANEVKMSSIELPTAISNLNGYNPESRSFNEHIRERNMQEVRDAIKFAADVAGGGGVDVLSWEYDRSIREADWNKGKVVFETPGSKEQEIGRVVDRVTGQIMEFRKGEKQFFPFDPSRFDPSMPFEKWTDQMTAQDPESNLPALHEWTWDQFVAVARRINAATKDPESQMTPEEVFQQMRMHRQYDQAKGYASYYKRQAEIVKHEMERAEDEEEKQRHRKEYTNTLALAAAQEQEAKQLENERTRMVDIGKFAVGKSTESYAEAGLAAWKETHNRQLHGNPIHVGPEMGWPQFFGSHPDEFIALIRASREKMKEALVQKYHLGADEAAKEARTHIKGVLDTSHLGMFFQYFEPHEADYDKRVEDFNKWFIAQIDKVAEVNANEDILGNVQIVNSMSGAHAHLPPNQGIFPVLEAANILKEKGRYNGFMTSEGHEEERFGQGRIVIDAWKMFDPNIIAGSGYTGLGGMDGGQRWSAVSQGYFGRQYGPMFLVGEGVPSQDFKLWSETPLE